MTIIEEFAMLEEQIEKAQNKRDALVKKMVEEYDAIATSVFCPLPEDWICIHSWISWDGAANLWICKKVEDEVNIWITKQYSQD